MQYGAHETDVWSIATNQSIGQHNKEQWHNELEAQVQHAHAHNAPLSVLFIDVNHFKDVNDILGHEVGDRVLHEIDSLNVELANSFRQAPSANFPERASDNLVHTEAASDNQYETIGLVPGRIGGDEFGVICHTDELGVEVIIERLREMFSSHLEKSPKDFRDIGLGLSIGASTLQAGMTTSELLGEADRAMYANKLEQLPSLTWLKKKYLKLGKYFVEKSGVRLRDLPKYERVED
jgi:GGDEF domain-containing protein